MKGKVKARFPKPNSDDGTWIIIVKPDDDSPDISEEMPRVDHKSHLPTIGQEVELVKGLLTWSVKD